MDISEVLKQLDQRYVNKIKFVKGTVAREVTLEVNEWLEKERPNIKKFTSTITDSGVMLVTFLYNAEIEEEE